MIYSLVKDRMTYAPQSLEDIEVEIYSIDDVSDHVIPNPFMDDVLRDIEYHYTIGFFTLLEKKYISRSLFDDPNNWT